MFENKYFPKVLKTNANHNRFEVFSTKLSSCVLFCVLPEYQNTPKTPEPTLGFPNSPNIAMSVEFELLRWLLRRLRGTGTRSAAHSLRRRHLQPLLLVHVCASTTVCLVRCSPLPHRIARGFRASSFGLLARDIHHKHLCQHHCQRDFLLYECLRREGTTE
jgi:hypothetical protein